MEADENKKDERMTSLEELYKLDVIALGPYWKFAFKAAMD